MAYTITRIASRKRKAPAPARKPEPPRPQLPRHSTIGELERLAGVEDRAAFWMPFAKIVDTRESFDAGVVELRRMAEARLAA